MDGVVVMEAPERIIAWAWETDRGHGEWDVKDTGGMPYVRYDLAQAPAPVRVRKLEWDDFDGMGAKASAFYQANYLIQWWKSQSQFEVSLSFPGYGTGYDGERWHPTFEAAKAAAQADYEARTLAALEAPDAGVVAELVEAAEEAIRALDYSAAEIADLENTLSSYRENWRDAKDAAVRLRAALALIAHNTTEG